MKQLLMSIKDSKTGVFSQPQLVVNENVAIRNVSIVLKDERSILSQCPNDFDLFIIGSFDDETGVVSSDIKLITNLGALKDVKTRSE